MIKNRQIAGTLLSRDDMKNIKGGMAPAGELWSCNVGGSIVQVCSPGTHPPSGCGTCDYITLCTSYTGCAV